MQTENKPVCPSADNSLHATHLAHQIHGLQEAEKELKKMRFRISLATAFPNRPDWDAMYRLARNIRDKDAPLVYRAKKKPSVDDASREGT